MKNFLKIAAIATFLVTGAYAASAQPQQRVSLEERAKTQLEMLSKKLELTDNQLINVDSIVLKNVKANQEAFANANGDREAMRKAMTENQEKFKEAMKAVLSDNQYKKFEDWLTEQRNRRSGSKR